eukprot:scaffold220059_cov45-Prasinocladus_malaysianus.AAC.1
MATPTATIFAIKMCSEWLSSSGMTSVMGVVLSHETRFLIIGNNMRVMAKSRRYPPAFAREKYALLVNRNWSELRMKPARAMALQRAKR